MKILLFFFSLILFSSSFMNVLAETRTVPLFYTKYSYTNNIVETVFDENNRLHVFLAVDEGSSYTIFHIINDELITVSEKVYQVNELFEAKVVPGGVGLFFMNIDYTRGSSLNYYYYNIENGSHSIQVIFEKGISDYEISIFQDTQNFTILEAYNKGYLATEITVYNCSFDGTLLNSTSYLIDRRLFEIEGFVYQNGKVFFYFFEPFSNEISYQNLFYIQGISYNGIVFNSSVIECPNYFYQLIVVQGLEKDFYLQGFQSGVYYYYSLDENETVEFSVFTPVNAYFYYYQKYSVDYSAHWINTTFLLFDYIYYYDNYDSEISLYVEAFVASYDTNTGLLFINDFTKQFQSSYNFGSDSVDLIINDAYYYFTYVEENSGDVHFNESSVLGVYMETNDMNIELPKDPQYYNVKEISDFIYFMKHYWWTLLLIAGILGIVYAIFYKKINKAIRKLKNFLLRPIVTDKSKFQLVFINLWLFFSNTFKLVFSLWKVNKKRLMINIFGLSILAFVLINTSVLYNSEQATVLQKYLITTDFGSNYRSSIDFRRQFLEQSSVAENISLINENYTSLAVQDIMSRLKSDAPIYSRLISDFQLTLSMSAVIANNSNVEQESTYHSINSSYNFLLDYSLINGTLPSKISEVLISESLAEVLDLQVGETIKFNSLSYLDIYKKYETINLTVTGIYRPIGYNIFNQLCEDENMPIDPVLFLNFDYPHIVTYNDFYIKNLENISYGLLQLYGSIEFIYDYSSLEIEELTQLIKEIELLSQNEMNFRFDPDGKWELSGEMQWIIYSFQQNLIIMRFLIYFLSIPIIFIALFLLSEVNSIFGSSFKQEIEILQSQGLSVGRISFLYSTMKFGESIIGTTLGLAGTFIFTPILLKVEKFPQFTNEIFYFTLKGSFVTIVVTYFALIFASLPQIMRLARRIEKQQKEPRKIVLLFKKLGIYNLLIIVFGVAISALGIYLLQLFSWIFEETMMEFLAIFVALIGIGAMVAMFGVGLLLKKLHNILLVIISKIGWKIKKSVRTFSLIEIRADSKMYTNTFFSFLLLISFIVPSIVAPIAIQDQVLKSVYFESGADVYIPNWTTYNTTLRSNISSFDEVQSTAHISVISAEYAGLQFYFFVIDNLTKFRTTVYDVPKYLIPDFDSLLSTLEQNNSMIVSDLFNRVFYYPQEFTFSDVNETTKVTVNITGEMQYFPIFFFGNRFLYNDYPIDYFDYWWFNYHIVLTKETYLEIKETLDFPIVSIDRLLIKLKPTVNPPKFKETLKRELDIDARDVKTLADLSLFDSYPFYSVLASMFVFTILMGIFALVFISLSNPLKILLHKASKTDILRKLGVKVSRIINISAFEILIASFVPGAIFGGVGAYGLYRLFKYIFIDFGWGTIIYKTYLFLPVTFALIGILGALYYTLFYFAMKVNFFKYRPRNLE